MGECANFSTELDSLLWGTINLSFLFIRRLNKSLAETKRNQILLRNFIVAQIGPHRVLLEKSAINARGAIKTSR